MTRDDVIEDRNLASKVAERVGRGRVHPLPILNTLRFNARTHAIYPSLFARLI